jgi:pilus assembly protein CpaE
MAGESILVVDDDRITRTLVGGVLEQQGYRVQTADDGLEALRLIAEGPPDLIITDVRMPYVNGLELTQRIRHNHRTARIPVIMLSDRKRSEEILAGYAEGADEYMPKPFDTAILVAKVAALLNRVAAASPSLPTAPLGTVVVFLRGKGGVGTTTLAVNAAVSLAAAGTRRVALVDLDLEFGNAAMLLDLAVERTLADHAEVPISEIDDDQFARLGAAHESGVRVIVGAGSPETAELVSISSVQQTIERLRAGHDFMLIDLPRTFSEIALAAIDASHTVCLITVPQVAALKATTDCLHVLDKLDIPAMGVRLVLNRITPAGLETDLVTRTLGRQPETIIPYSALCEDAANAGRPLVTYRPGSPGAVAMEDMAATITRVAPASRSDAAAPPGEASRWRKFWPTPFRPQ